ncbi:hypothetical protein P4C99_20960, partial [Pontiellaceae bacterium B1224]|nr:hypothetical protein [Pontiellaceae bacterium B1224]
VLKETISLYGSGLCRSLKGLRKPGGGKWGMSWSVIVDQWSNLFQTLEQSVRNFLSWTKRPFLHLLQ